MKPNAVLLAMLGWGAVIAGSATALAEPGSFSHRAECKKNSTAGCTADTTDCYDVPSGHVVMRSSVRITSQGQFRELRCIPSYANMKQFAVTTDRGKKFTMNEPSRICINAHAESGSGPAHLGDVAWVNCAAAFNVEEFE